MEDVKQLREIAGVSQSELARLASTSQSTIAAYESGRKSPTLKTLRRLARAVERDAQVIYVAHLTREDRRSLALHAAIAARVRRDPEGVILRARRTLGRMRAANSGASDLLDEWSGLLDGPLPVLLSVLRDPGLHARELRHATPFAGVLSAAERARVIRDFALAEEREP